MQTTTLNLEFVTPCFLGGASPEVPEWRAASVRGQLRWWFRAIAGGKLGGQPETTRKLEAAVFGTTNRASALTVRTLGAPRAMSKGRRFAHGEPLTASQIAALWQDTSKPTIDRLRLLDDHQKEFPVNPLQYLAYGPVDRGQLLRGCFYAGEAAKLELRWSRSPGADARALFDLALWAWLNLGGIGSRSRKGFGSLSAIGATDELAPRNREALQGQLRQKLRALVEPNGPSLPEWTCFSSASRVYLGQKTFPTWHEALSHLGAWLMAYRRRYGNPSDGRVLGGLALAGRDYAWAANPSASGAEVPDRAGFGLPLAFRFGADKRRETSVLLDDEKAAEARRASPLLLHVTRLGPSNYLPVLTYLPARFLPAKQRLRLKQRTGPQSTRASAPTPGQLDVIERFLTDLKAKKLIEEVTP